MHESAPATAFPDANFRAELVKLGFPDDDIDPDNDTNKALFRSTTELFLCEKKIASLAHTSTTITPQIALNARITKVIK